MKNILGPVLVIFTLLTGSALASEPYCPEGNEEFIKDKDLKSCNDDEQIGAVGPNLKPLHLFDIRKTYHPENVLVVFSALTSDCKFPEDTSTKDLIDFYWRMREGSRSSCKKESAVKDRIKNKIKIHSVSEDRTQMVIYLDDLDKVRHDLPDRAATITLSKENSNSCNAQISFALSSTDKSKKLNLYCVHGETAMLFFGIPSLKEEVESLTLFGTDENGKPISKRYEGR